MQPCSKHAYIHVGQGGGQVGDKGVAGIPGAIDDGQIRAAQVLGAITNEVSACVLLQCAAGKVVHAAKMAQNGVALCWGEREYNMCD